MTATEQAGLIAAARAAAAAHILPRFRRLDPTEVATKSGPADLVTIADTEAEAAIAAAVRTLMPDATVMGEESIAADPSLRDRIATAARSVIIDPLDGTWNFAKGIATFGVILAVAEAGRTVFGLLYDPLMDDWIVASRDGPARMVHADGRVQPLATSPEARPERMTGYIPLAMIRRAKRADMAATFPGFRRAMSLRCSCHEYRMVAQGHAEFCLSGSLHAWDHAAGALIVRQAGGVARLLDGRHYDAGQTTGTLLTAGSEPAWQALAERFAFLLE